jgi:hypothetical protein
MEVRTSGRGAPEKGLEGARTIGTVSVCISLIQDNVTCAEMKDSLAVSLPVFSICTDCANDRMNPFWPTDFETSFFKIQGIAFDVVHNLEVEVTSRWARMSPELSQFRLITRGKLRKVFTGFSSWQWFIVDVDYALVSLHRLNVDSIVDVSEVYATSDFRVKVSKVSVHV